MEQTKISGPQNTQATHAARAKSPAKQGVPDAGNDAGANGFLALLSAMGDVSGESMGLAAPETAVVPTDWMADASTGVVDASVAAWHGLLGTAIVEGAAGIADGLAASGSIGTSSFPSDGSGVATVGTFGAGGGAIGAAWSGLALDGRSQGLVAETMKLDTSADLKDVQPFGTTTGFSRAFSRLQGAQAQRAGMGGAQDVATGQVVAGESVQHRVGGHAAAATLAQSMTERVSPGAQQAAAAGERAAGVQTVPMGAELTGAGALAAGVGSALASSQGTDAPGGGRAGEGQPGSNGGVGVGVASATQEAGAVDGAPTFSDANPMAAEEQVADQVAYWVNQKTQNAEMTLQRDGPPVEVSVSLSGNEAHVSFRSDQAETRALLDQSMAQLSEMLRAQGLVLSGMSVGTSAQGGSGANAEGGQPGAREGARQAQVVSKAPAGTSSLVRGAVASDRAVDIFV